MSTSRPGHPRLHPGPFIDWTWCAPGSPLDDLGYMAWTWCVQAQGHVPIADQAAHLRELRDGYGDIAPADLLAAMVDQQTRVVDQETAKLDNPALGPARRDHARAAIAWAAADRDLVRQHHALLPSALE